MSGRVVVDRDACIGAGMCLVFAPESFTHDEESKAVVVDQHGDPEEAVDTAVEGCPTGALSRVTDGATA
ncbi:ferredoxin [Actinomadura algeriensis]|uniref:Ferredoxin n=1 Tax=Actinomadura algeriensis TaxID=1679523 RepID=A0ABR9K205_9ACTN|nr:ferredoxin [Actinomadura algeriensis]MBE1536852.1 ferredoxin [Actinomadura algeriensis]